MQFLIFYTLIVKFGFNFRVIFFPCFVFYLSIVFPLLSFNHPPDYSSSSISFSLDYITRSHPSSPTNPFDPTLFLHIHTITTPFTSCLHLHAAIAILHPCFCFSFTALQPSTALQHSSPPDSYLQTPSSTHHCPLLLTSSPSILRLQACHIHSYIPIPRCNSPSSPLFLLTSKFNHPLPTCNTLVSTLPFFMVSTPATTTPNPAPICFNSHLQAAFTPSVHRPTNCCSIANHLLPASHYAITPCNTQFDIHLRL